MSSSVKNLSDRLSWTNVGQRHIDAYRKASKLWGIYSSSPTVAFSGIQGEAIDFMQITEVSSSTGSETDELASLADDLQDDLPTPPPPEEVAEIFRNKMIEDIDSMEGETDD